LLPVILFIEVFMLRISLSGLMVIVALLANLAPVRAAAPSLCPEVQKVVFGDRTPETQAAIRQVIQAGANLNERCQLGGQEFIALPLLVAIDQVELAQFLIEKGADVKAKDSDGNNALHHLGTSESLLKLLLSKGADVNDQNNSGIAPIHNVFGRYNLAIVKQLVAAGANVNVRSKELLTPLHLVSDPAISAFLISRGAKINAKTNQNWTPLHYAASKLEVARLLIRAGADLTAQNRFGAPIHSSDLSPEVLKLMLAQRVNVNLRNADRQTPLRAHRLHPEITRILLTKGAQVNLQDNLGRSPLHDVNIDVAKQLVKAGGNINLPDNQGQTPLHRAVLEEESYFGPELVSLFISRNVKANLKDKQGKTALAIACELQKTEIIKLLQTYQTRHNQPATCPKAVN
jgi:uncharacterized protein